MNWNAINFDWNQIRAFFATVEQGSFSGAARVLKSTQPTIGRQIAALEETLGLTLFERTGRSLELTGSGSMLLEHVKDMTEAATLISMIADSQAQDLSGDVALTTTDLFACSMLPSMFKPIRAKYPKIRLRIICSNENQNLIKREADIAIRHSRPDQPDLVAKYIGSFTASLYGASDYLDQAGRPTTTDEISSLDFVGNADPDRLIAPLRQMGIHVDHQNFVLSTEQGAVAWEMVKAGYGVAMQPDMVAKNQDGIEKVFPSLPSPEFPVWLVTHRELKTSPKIRAIFDELANVLSKYLSL